MTESKARPGCCVDHASTPGGYCEGQHAARCMRMPEGKTCGDCAHLRRCELLGFTPSAKETTCSFHPRRFREREVVA